MLREIHIRNFALIEDARVRFGPGFNVLTGETGVGKSLVLGALNLLLGGRPNAGLIRAGAEDLCVEGLFDIPSPRLRAELAQTLAFDIEPDVTEILLEREYSLSGRNRCRANGKPVSVTTLRDAGQLLVDIHGQREHESLLVPANQRSVLDAYGQLEPLRDRFAERYAALTQLRRRLDELRQTEEVRREKRELLSFRLQEIEALNPVDGEYTQLREERDLLANAEKVSRVVAQGLDSLYESDGSATERAQALTRDLEPLAAFHPDLRSALEAVIEAAAQLEEAAYALRHFRESFDFDASRLEQIEERLRRYDEIARKHSAAPEDLAAMSQRLKENLDALDAETRDLSELESRIADASKDLLAVGHELTKARQAAGRKLSPQVEREMRNLAMPAGRFSVAVMPAADAPSGPEPAGASGMDAVEMLLSTNPGEDLKPLRMVGSGGEVARIMLAIKGCLAQVDRTPVFIFDEIDANIGGRIGAVIGEKIAAIAHGRQVICITHLPQIAAYAAIHLKVEKRVTAGRSVTRIIQLDAAGREAEIAQMIHGDQATDTTLRQAKEMIDLAGKALARLDRQRPARRKT